VDKLYVWDLDGTIRPGSLLGDGIVHGIAAGFMTAEDYATPAEPTYADADTFLRDITGRSRHDFTDLITRLGEQARSQAHPWVLAKLEEQQQTGTVVVLSHSPDFLVKAYCRGLGISTASGSYFHTQAYIFSGRAVLLDKRRMLAKHLRKTGIAQASFAAGDSINDLPLLEKAKQAVVINPSEELAVIAERNGWEIIRTKP
jgi:phosphoserine phosphatase